MANHVSHASLPFPVKGARYTIEVPYLDADGDPTDPTTPDTEISKDGGAFADCAEEVSTVSGSNGFGYLTLSGAEMDCSLALVAAKVASGPKATLESVRPRVLPVLRSGTAQAGANGSITLDPNASAIDDYYNGCIVRTTGGTGGGGTGGANNQARVITDYNGSTKVATIVPNWETNPAGDTTFEVLATEMAVAVLADVVGWRGSSPNALQSGRVDAYLGAVANGSLAAASFAAGAFDAVWERATSALTSAGTIGKLLVDTLNATIGSRASQASVDAVDDFVDTEIAAIKAKTDNLPANPASQTRLDELCDNRLTAGRAANLDNLDASISSRSTLSAAQANAEVVDALAVDASAEPGAPPAANAPLAAKIGWLFAWAKNKVTQTTTQQKVRNDADNADIGTAAVSDDGTTFTRGKYS